jgi:hydroxymethylglutaryl-CoA lyase
LTDTVQIVEVGPRDGLQNEDAILDAPTKVELIHRLVAAGTSRIEVASFVHPDRVPQMADAESVVAGLGPSPDGASYIGLVLNRRGLDRALATTVDEVNFVVGASEGFNAANTGLSPDQTMRDIEAMLPDAVNAGRTTSVTISVAFGCPYDGEVPVDAVVELARRAAESGAGEIALGDTIGVAVPTQVTAAIESVRPVVGGAVLRCHFHDTRNTGAANAVAAYQAGVSVLDASVGGTGGCPYAPNATGNVATEDLLYLFERMGVHTGIDHEATIATGRWLGEQLGKTLPAAVARAGWWPE